MKRLNVMKIFFFSNLRNFCESHPPKSLIKYKLIDFAPKKSIMANKFPSNWPNNFTEKPHR